VRTGRVKSLLQLASETGEQKGVCFIAFLIVLPSCAHLPARLGPAFPRPLPPRAVRRLSLGSHGPPPTHLHFMTLQHICFGLVIKPKSKMSFVKLGKKPPGLDLYCHPPGCGQGNVDTVDSGRRLGTRPAASSTPAILPSWLEHGRMRSGQ
jgi:hypothetical protein